MEMLIGHERGNRTGRLMRRVGWLWRYRYFLWMFVYQRIRIQYAGSALGILWSLLNPLMMTAVFTIMFTFVASNHSIKSYPVFLLAGLLPWHFFSTAVSVATVSVVEERELIKKARFPTELLPIASTLGALPNFLGGLLVFAVLALLMGVQPTAWLLLLPIVIALEILLAIGLGLFLATANVFYRDIQSILQVALQAWFFLTPVWYSMDFLPQELTLLGIQVNPQRWLRIFNPMASLIAAYRDILYWGRPTDPAFLLRTSVTVIVILLLGYLFFLRHCARFPENL
jgi:lipopolysaccharide transport system permease protein